MTLICDIFEIALLYVVFVIMQFLCGSVVFLRSAILKFLNAVGMGSDGRTGSFGK